MNKMICIVVSLCFLIHLSTTYAESNQKVNYPSNRNKSFVSEDIFYKQLDKKIYKEYNNASKTGGDFLHLFYFLIISFKV